MKKHAQKLIKLAKENKLLVANAGILVVGLLATSVYAGQVESRLDRMEQESQTELQNKLAVSKTKLEARLASEKKEAEAVKLAQQQAAAEEEAKKKEAAAAAEAAKKKTESAPSETKKKTEPSYQEVSASVVRSGANVVGTIGSTKPGTCYFVFKNYTDPNNPTYSDYLSASATNGSCTLAIPGGTWTHVKLEKYKSNDGLTKAYGPKIEL